MAKIDGKRLVPAEERWLVLALAITIVGGIILLVETFGRLPPAVTTAGAGLFLVGCGLAATTAFRVSRRTGDSVPRSLWRALKALLSWFFGFLP